MGLGDSLEDLVQGAEIDGFNDFGFAVHALALPGIVIGAAVDGFGGEGGHNVLGHTTGGMRGVSGIPYIVVAY